MAYLHIRFGFIPLRLSGKSLAFGLLLLVFASPGRALDVVPLQAPAETRVMPFAPGIPRSFKPAWRGDVRELPGMDAKDTMAVVFPRGDGRKPGLGGTLRADRPVWVYLSVFDRGRPSLPGWQPTNLHLTWINDNNDLVVDRLFERAFPAGTVEIPPHDGREGSDYGVPHLVLIRETPLSEPVNLKTPEQLRDEWLQGETLSNGAIEVTVTSRPYLRLTALRRPGEVDWLRPRQKRGDWGLRTWVMIPSGENPALNALSYQPAQIERSGPLRLEARAAPDHSSGLSLHWTVELDPHRARLKITHTIRNQSARTQTVAPWAIALVNFDGAGRTLASAEDARPDSAPTAYLMTGIDQAGPAGRRLILDHGQIGLRLAGPADDTLKIGSRSRGGWVLYERPDGSRLVSRSPLPEGIIPDGGRNLTLYHRGTAAEIEHVGALAALAPGEETTLEQDLTVENPQGAHQAIYIPRNSAN